MINSILKIKTFFTFLSLIFFINLACAARAQKFIPESLRVGNIPNRPQDAMNGTEFAALTASMAGSERQKIAISEIEKGNIPEFLRNLKPVRMDYLLPHGKKVMAVIWVMPDYLAIGSDDDFLRIPLTYSSALEVINKFGFILPTRKMVDAIYAQATCHLEPEPLPPAPHMRSSEYYLKHRELIRAQRLKAGCKLGELVSGHKKDVVLTNRLNDKLHRVAIYGWHRKDGDPIQPLSTIHGDEYADYSHGIRLVSQTVFVDGEPRSIIDILQNRLLAPLLTYEGIFSKLLRMLRLR